MYILDIGFVSMFVTSLKGVGPTDTSKEDGGSTVKAAAIFICCQDMRCLFRYSAFFSLDNRSLKPSSLVDVVSARQLVTYLVIYFIVCHV